MDLTPQKRKDPRKVLNYWDKHGSGETGAGKVGSRYVSPGEQGVLGLRPGFSSGTWRWPESTCAHSSQEPMRAASHFAGTCRGEDRVLGFLCVGLRYDSPHFLCRGCALWLLLGGVLVNWWSSPQTGGRLFAGCLCSLKGQALWAGCSHPES